MSADRDQSSGRRDRGSGEPAGDPIDTLIDDTARALTAGSPSGALRERVRARLVSRGSWDLGRVWRPAVGAAAAVALAVWVVWPSSGDAPGVAPVSRTAPLARSAEAVPPAAPAVETPGPAPVRTRRVDARPTRRSGEDSFAALADALPPIDPIEIEPVPPSTVARIEQMPTPMPLRFEQLEFERLLFE